MADSGRGGDARRHRGCDRSLRGELCAPDAARAGNAAGRTPRARLALARHVRRARRLAAAVARQTGRLRVHAPVAGAQPPAPPAALFVRRARAGVRALGYRAPGPARAIRPRSRARASPSRPPRSSSCSSCSSGCARCSRFRSSRKRTGSSGSASPGIGGPSSPESRRALIVACVLPVTLAAGASVGIPWGARLGLAHALFCALMGFLLTELLLIRFCKVPFTCTYFPGRARMRTLWPFYLVGFSTYTYTAGAARSGCPAEEPPGAYHDLLPARRVRDCGADAVARCALADARVRSVVRGIGSRRDLRRIQPERRARRQLAHAIPRP